MRAYDRVMRAAQRVGVLGPALLVAAVVLSFAVATVQLGRMPRTQLDSAWGLGGAARTAGLLGWWTVLLSLAGYAFALPALLVDGLVQARARGVRAALPLLAALVAGAGAAAFVHLDPLYMVIWFMD
jgi:hypothetical protein